MSRRVWFRKVWIFPRIGVWGAAAHVPIHCLLLFQCLLSLQNAIGGQNNSPIVINAKTFVTNICRRCTTLVCVAEWNSRWMAADLFIPASFPYPKLAFRPLGVLALLGGCRLRILALFHVSTNCKLSLNHRCFPTTPVSDCSVRWPGECAGCVSPTRLLDCGLKEKQSGRAKRLTTYRYESGSAVPAFSLIGQTCRLSARYQSHSSPALRRWVVVLVVRTILRALSCPRVQSRQMQPS